MIGLTLAFCGGYIDAYTYVLREHSLVAGQTGNIVFLAVDIASKGLVLTETRFFTLVFFILGIFTISFLAKKTRLSLRQAFIIAPLHLGLSSDRVLTCQYT